MSVPKQRTETVIWGVHLARRDATRQLIVGPTVMVCSNEPLAQQEAFERSKDAQVLAASVTRYILDRTGDHKRVSLYVEGKRQLRPYCTDGPNHTYILG